MKSNIPPALTPDEWEILKAGRTLEAHDVAGKLTGMKRKHGIAAVMLYGTPVGFTERHAKALFAMAELLERFGKTLAFSQLSTAGPAGEALDLADCLDEIRFRIDALLPPRAEDRQSRYEVTNAGVRELGP